MSPINPCQPDFSLAELAEFSQPPVDGGLINAVFYARQKYGTRPPAGYTPNLQAVIALLQRLESQESDLQTKASITGAVQYLEYLNSTVLPQLPGIMGQLLQQMINATLE